MGIMIKKKKRICGIKHKYDFKKSNGIEGLIEWPNGN